MVKYLGSEVEVLAINSAAAVPADGTVSASFAIPQKTNYLAMSVRPVGTYDTISVSLQIATNDVAGEYATLKTSVAVGGEYYISNALVAKFCRVVVTSSTGASRTGLVVGLLVK
jgi:hypothetical protein